MNPNYLIFAVGFTAQLFFFTRSLVQWIKSERAGSVLSPTLFWQLSLLGSILMLIYGVLRDDFVIILGQLFSYVVYIRNLQLKNAWGWIPAYFKFIVISLPLVAIAYLWFSNSHHIDQFLNNPEVSLPLLLWGSLGQVIFAFRFLYQWFYSERVGKSILPLGFWTISISGSLIIISYAIIRHDPVLFLGHACGMIIYARNILLHFKNTKFQLE